MFIKKEVLKRLNHRVTRVRPEIRSSWRLHHENAPSHTTFVVNSNLTRISVSTVPQPSYSPNVAPADFFLFPRVKRELKGKHLETLDNIQRTTTRCLNSIPQSGFQRAYDAWKTRWQRCIDAGGDYFEEY